MASAQHLYGHGGTRMHAGPPGAQAASRLGPPGWGTSQAPALTTRGNVASPAVSGAGKGAVQRSRKGGKSNKTVLPASPRPFRYELGPDDPPPYGDMRYSSTYWDARHAAIGDVPFDWYLGYDRLAGVLRQRLPPASEGAEILDIGFGTSEMPACLHADGWTNVTAIDTSVVAVTRARNARRHNGRSELQFLQMDACKTEFPEKCFDAVIDKALLDTLVTGGHAFPRVRDMLAEVYRILRPGGVYFCVSHSAAATRLPYLAHDSSKQWRIEVARIEKAPPARTEPEDEVPDDVGGGYFHVYICTKPPASDAEPSLMIAPDPAASRGSQASSTEEIEDTRT